jgi:hypothetical protein
MIILNHGSKVLFPTLSSKKGAVFSRIESVNGVRRNKDFGRCAKLVSGETQAGSAGEQPAGG